MHAASSGRQPAHPGWPRSDGRNDVGGDPRAAHGLSGPRGWLVWRGPHGNAGIDGNAWPGMAWQRTHGPNTGMSATCCVSNILCFINFNL